MSSKFATITGIPVQYMFSSMEEIAHAASVKKPNGDWRHILNCPSLGSSYQQDASWQKSKKEMQLWRLPADFWTAWEKGIQHLPRDIKKSTIPALPFQISINPTRNHLQAAFQEKNSIKWTNLLKGRMSYKCQQFTTAHVR
jgi:hypothetical protein